MADHVFEAVVILKADLDTVSAGFLLGVAPSQQVLLVADVASPAQLQYPRVLCLECGGAGQPQLGNFDHHAPGGPRETAVEQAWAAMGHPAAMARLVEYVSRHDRGMTESAEDRNLSLIGVFSAMRGAVLGEIERFREGLSLLAWFTGLRCDPCGPLAVLATGMPAIETNTIAAPDGPVRRELVDAGTTAEGRRLAVAAKETQTSPRQLYDIGFEIAVAETETLSGSPFRRLTVALDPRCGHVCAGVRAIDRIRRRLNMEEDGWGGPASGTILGSPRGRSSTLTLDLVADICREEG